MSNKLQNIKANKELLAGTHKSQTRKSFGYTGEGTISKRAIGDIWIEKDPISGVEYKIEQKNGFRTKTPLNSILQQVRNIMSVPNECPCCKKKMRDEEKSLNFKMYFKHKKCFECVIKEETMIRLKGQEAWEEYSRKFMLANAEAWLADTDKEVEILRNSLKVQFTQNADGGLEEWDQSAFFEKFDKDYQELRKTIITNLKGENGNS
jgi:hypothetical protein